MSRAHSCSLVNAVVAVVGCATAPRAGPAMLLGRTRSETWSKPRPRRARSSTSLSRPPPACLDCDRDVTHALKCGTAAGTALQLGPVQSEAWSLCAASQQRRRSILAGQEAGQRHQEITSSKLILGRWPGVGAKYTCADEPCTSLPQALGSAGVLGERVHVVSGSFSARSAVSTHVGSPGGWPREQRCLPAPDGYVRSRRQRSALDP